MLNAPMKHSKSSSSGGHHHHHHHHHYHHSSTSSKPLPNLSTHIKIQDNFKLLPRYSVALSKPHDECLPTEELDAIQAELEVLLSSVALRYRSLKTDFDYLEDRKHQKKSSSDKQPNSPSTSKRKRDEKKSSKVSSRYSGHQQTKHSRIKTGSSSHSPAYSQHTDDSNTETVPYTHPTVGGSHPNQKLIVPKNDIPNKFWLSVEPYCMPITQEDIKMLDDLIDEYTEPLVPIPELGPNYALRWTTNDMRDEQRCDERASKRAAAQSKAASNSTTKKTSNDIEKPSTEGDASKKGEKSIGEGVTGPLTQRLVAGLLEEQIDIIGSSDGTATLNTHDSSDSCAENNSSSANRSHTAAITSLLKSGIDVEKRLQKELLDLGILDASDFPKDKDDEVLNEIKRVRTELSACAQYNLSELKLLRLAAMEEMKRLEIKRKLDRIDQEIIEAYKRVASAKQKRRPLTKHERNEIYRLSDEQKRLSDLLETMPIPGFNSTVCAQPSTTTQPSAETSSNTATPIATTSSNS